MELETNPEHPDNYARPINQSTPDSADITSTTPLIDSESTPPSSLLDVSLPVSHDHSDSELRYAADTELLDTPSDTPSLPALSPSGLSLNESFASLSRSTSTSSSGSGDYDFGAAPTSRYGNDAISLAQTRGSAVSENNLLNSPPPEDEDYCFFPTAYTSAAAISDWRNSTSQRRESYDEEDISNHRPVTSVYFDCLDEPEMMYSNHQLPGVAGGVGGVGGSASAGIGRPRYVGDLGGLVDGAEYDGYRGGSNGNYTSSQSTGGAYGGYGNSRAGGVRRSGTGAGGSGSGRGDGNDERNSRRRPSVFSAGTASSSSEVTSEEEDESADESKPAKGVSNSDDDVPLAQSIPTALTAQKSIRKQVREERDQRRRERAERAARTEARSRQTTLRPAGAGGPVVPQAVLSSSQEAALHASSPAKPTTRPRTQTLPGRAAPPFSPEDLTKKLQDVQVSSSLRHRRGPSNALSGEVDAYGVLARPDASSAPDGLASKSLRPSRSFHRSQGHAVEDHRSLPLPINATKQVQRVRSQSRLREEKPTFEDASRVPVPRMNEDQRRLVREPSTRSTATRPSVDGERRLTRPNTANSEYRPPLPPLPATVPDVSAAAPPKQVTQQRIFIGDMQRYNVVEIDDATSAGEVVEMVEAQGSLKGWIGSGDWMVWELAHDFGMGMSVFVCLH